MVAGDCCGGVGDYGAVCDEVFGDVGEVDNADYDGCVAALEVADGRDFFAVLPGLFEPGHDVLFEHY